MWDKASSSTEITGKIFGLLQFLPKQQRKDMVKLCIKYDILQIPKKNYLRNHT